MRRRSRVREQATYSLREMIREYRVQGAERLPSSAALAQFLCVSPPTVLRICRELAAEGVLTVKQGSPIRIAGADTGREAGTAHPVPRKVKSELIRDAVRERILAGAWDSIGFLPSQKQLCQEFCTTRPTVNKALRLLAAEGIIELRGGARRIVSPARQHGSAAIVLIGRGNEGRVFLPSPTGERVLETLESACHSNGIGVINTLGSFATPKEFRYGIDWTRPEALEKSSRAVLGFVVHQHVLGLDDGRLLRGLSRHGLPVAVLCANTVEPPRARLASSPLAWVVPSDDRRAGAEVARHLCTHGHRITAFVTVYRNQRWSKQRFQGYRDEFGRRTSDAGYVHLYATDEKGPSYGPDRASRLSARGASFATEVLASSNAAADPFRERWLRSTAREAMGMLEDIRDFDRAAFDDARGLFDEALKVPGLSAVVCANDKLANLCHMYLRWKGIAVPGDIALCSFDDSMTALSNGITSYNFNAAGAAHRAVTHVTHPHRSRRPGRWEVQTVTVDGFLSVRSSSV